MPGFRIDRGVFTGDELAGLRDGVEAAVALAAAADVVLEAVSDAGHRITTTVGLRGGPPTSVHREPGGDVVRDLRPVAHLDDRLARCADDPRLTGPAARMLGTDQVDLLTSKISFKRARVGSAYIWHTDHSFLARFLDPWTAAEVVTAMVFLDDADADDGNGALRLIPGSHRAGPRPDGEGPRPGEHPPISTSRVGCGAGTPSRSATSPTARSCSGWRWTSSPGSAPPRGGCSTWVAATVRWRPARRPASRAPRSSGWTSIR